VSGFYLQADITDMASLSITVPKPLGPTPNMVSLIMQNLSE
jgi:hypothetical protein